MFIREALRKNKGVGLAVGAVLLGVAGWAMVMQVRAIRNEGPQPVNSRAFYTVDDGATWFADDARRGAPFEHQGKQAVKAYVWKCGGGAPFITYLERINPESKAKLDRLRSGGHVEEEKAAPSANPMGMPEGARLGEGTASSRPGGGEKAVPRGVLELTLSRDLQVKKAGTGQGGWVKFDSLEGRKVARTACPDGVKGDLEPIEP